VKDEHFVATVLEEAEGGERLVPVDEHVGNEDDEPTTAQAGRYVAKARVGLGAPVRARLIQPVCDLGPLSRPAARLHPRDDLVVKGRQADRVALPNQHQRQRG